MKRFKMTTLHGVIALLLLVALLVMFTGSYFFYFMFMSIFSAVLLMFILVQNNKRRIFQFLNFSTHEMVAGDALKLDITSSNNSVFPVSHAKISCKIYNEEHAIVLPTENIFFNPFQIINMQEEFTIRSRGIFTQTMLITEVADPLRLFKKTIHFERPLQLMVYPRIYELSYFQLPTTGYLGTHKVVESGHEDYSSLKKVRPYIHGDSMKKIHWKLSSKREEFFVKEYDSTSSTKVNLFVDAYSEHYKGDKERRLEDRVVEIAASITKYALTRNAETAMYYQAKMNVNIESRDLASFQNLLKDLVTFSPKGDLAFSEVISQETKRFEQGSFVVLVTTQVNKKLTDTIMGLKRRSFKVSLILVNEKAGYDQEKEVLKAMGVKLYDIHPEDDIVEKLEAF